MKKKTEETKEMINVGRKKNDRLQKDIADQGKAFSGFNKMNVFESSVKADGASLLLPPTKPLQKQTTGRGGDKDANKKPESLLVPHFGPEFMMKRGDTQVEHKNIDKDSDTLTTFDIGKQGLLQIQNPNTSGQMSVVSPSSRSRQSTKSPF